MEDNGVVFSPYMASTINPRSVSRCVSFREYVDGLEEFKMFKTYHYGEFVNTPDIKGDPYYSTISIGGLIA